MAHCPDWYSVMQAAKYLGVPPWDLMEQPLYWKDKALVAMSAEAGAQEQLQEHERKKQKGGQA